MLRSVHGRSRRARAGVLGSALLTGAVLPAAGLGAVSASAATSCVTTAGTTTCTFPYTGTATSWPVPPGVTSLTVVADGGAGGHATDVINNGAGYVYPPGGPGGQYKATLTGIPAGTTLSIFPGGSGANGGMDAGHGGGSGGYTILIPDYSGYGGGASTVAIAPFSVASLLVVAGAGGGTALNTDAVTEPDQVGGAGGGSGHVDGRAGGDGGSPGGGGGGGTTTMGGAGGTLSGCISPGAAGGQLQGGNSASGAIHAGECAAGGGGGSGYFGGGGAGAGGGGGGSGFPAATTVVDGITVTPDTADTSTNAGNGVVSISYATLAATGPIVSGYRADRCVADSDDSAANNTPIVVAACDGSPGQDWTVTSTGTLQINGKCLNVSRDEKKALVKLDTCTGAASQQWRATAGTLVNPVSGKCLDGFSTTPGTQLEIFTCNGAAGQQWKLP